MKLKESLEKKKFVVTSEVQGAVDESPEQLVKNLELVRGRVDGVTVPEVEIEGVVGDSIKTCEILNKNRFEAIYQTTHVTKTVSSSRRTFCRHTNPALKICSCSRRTIALRETVSRR